MPSDHPESAVATALPLPETPTLGVLTRSSRVATNVYETLMAARGKPVLFFPARFDMHEVQAADGYAYNIAIQRFNTDFRSRSGPSSRPTRRVDWWGGAVAVPWRAAIASFMGDTAESMMRFSRILPARIPRIALVDFNNDSVRIRSGVLEVMFRKYQQLCDQGDCAPKRRNILCTAFGWTPVGLCAMSLWSHWVTLRWTWVSTCLVFNVRHGLDSAFESWELPQPGKMQRGVLSQCQDRGFWGPTPRRPASSKSLGSRWIFMPLVPGCSTITAALSQTSQVMWCVRVHGEWIDMAKVGRKPLDNPNLERVW